MKAQLAGVMVWAAVCAAPAQAADAKADMAAIHAVDQAWLKAFKAADGEALGKLYDEDAVLLPPGAPAVTGRAAIRDFLRKEALGASQAEVGWILHPDVHGRGVGSEAAREMLRVGFEHYGFHRIYAELDARNGPSARLAERLGMRREAHRIQDFWSQGEWTDSYQYAILATEWPPPHA